MEVLNELELERFVATNGTVYALAKIRSDDTLANLIQVDAATGDLIFSPYTDDGSFRFEDSLGNPIAVGFNVEWSNVLNTPTTLSGYGLLGDAYTEAEIDTLLAAKAPTSRQVTAGIGITGGGALSADRSFAFDTAWGDARYALAAHEHAAADITSGVFGLDRGGLGFDTIGKGELIYASAADTLAKLAGAATDGWVITWNDSTGVPEWAAPTGGVDNAFASVANNSGVVQFSASGSAPIQFAVGSDLAVAFDAVNNRVTYSYVGGGSGGVSAAWSTMAVGGSSVTATGADTFTFAGAGGVSPTLDVGAKTITYTLGNHSGTLITSGSVGPAVGGTGITTYAAGDLLYASAANTLSKLAAGTNGYVLTLAGGVPTWAAAPSSGVATGDSPTWTGSHTFNNAVAFGSYLQGTTGNGYLDLRGDSGATYGLRLTDGGHLGFGSTDIEAWSLYRVIEGTGTAIAMRPGAPEMVLFANAYYDGAFKYKDSGAAAYYQMDGGKHVFAVTTSGSENATIGGWNVAFQINENGLLGIGGATPGNTQVNAQFNGSAYDFMRINNTAATTIAHLTFRNQGSTVGSVTCSTTATAYNTSSDRRLKDLHGVTALGIEQLRLITAWDGAWKRQPDRVEQFFVAQEIQPLAPWAVHADRETGMLSMDYGRLTPWLARSIQQVDDRQTRQEKALRFILDKNPGLRGREQALAALAE